MTELISVLTPTANRRAWFPLAVHCFLAQTYKHVEWVILDDGDDPIEDLVPKLPNVHYHRADTKMPLGAKRNRLIELARGDFLAFWDDDDYYFATRLAKQAYALRAHPSVPAAGTSRMLAYDTATDKLFWVGPFGREGFHATAATVMFRRTYDGRFPEDALRAEETAFFKNWSVPIHQVDPFECIVVMCHAGNTVGKTRFMNDDTTLHQSLRSLLRRDRAALALLPRA